MLAFAVWTYDQRKPNSTFEVRPTHLLFESEGINSENNPFETFVTRAV